MDRLDVALAVMESLADGGRNARDLEAELVGEGDERTSRATLARTLKTLLDRRWIVADRGFYTLDWMPQVMWMRQLNRMRSRIEREADQVKALASGDLDSLLLIDAEPSASDTELLEEDPDETEPN